MEGEQSETEQQPDEELQTEQEDVTDGQTGIAGIQRKIERDDRGTPKA